MIDPSRVRLAGPLALYRDSLWADLLAQGYSPLSSANVLRLMAHLSRWLEVRGIELQDLDSERLDEFLEHRKAAGYTCWFSPRGLEPVLGHLRRVGAIRPSEPPPRAATAREVLLDAYKDYLVRERALASVTTAAYLHIARQFLKDGKKARDLSRLTAVDITSFILRESSSHSAGYAQYKVTALRSLLRYLHVRGDLTTDLTVAVPAVAGRRLVGLPRGLEPDEVRSLLKGCDRRTPVGRRDFAALLLMVRLGLRACEVANLNLEDFHWVRGEVVIRGKRGREDRLPLPRDIGEALVSYLKSGRLPRTAFRQLFLRVRAPHGGLTSGAVQRIVRQAGKKIGLASLGAHRLRHTAATQMLRNGASMPQIAQVLRHRHLDTTAIYAKVDRSCLRELSRSWPGEER